MAAAGLADSASGIPVGEEVLEPSLPSVAAGMKFGLPAWSPTVSSLLKKIDYYC